MCLLRCIAVIEIAHRAIYRMTLYLMPVMAIRVVEFSNGGYKIRKVFALNMNDNFYDASFEVCTAGIDFYAQP